MTNIQSVLSAQTAAQSRSEHASEAHQRAQQLLFDLTLWDLIEEIPSEARPQVHAITHKGFDTPGSVTEALDDTHARREGSGLLLSSSGKRALVIQSHFVGFWHWCGILVVAKVFSQRKLRLTPSSWLPLEALDAHCHAHGVEELIVSPWPNEVSGGKPTFPHPLPKLTQVKLTSFEDAFLPRNEWWDKEVNQEAVQDFGVLDLQLKK